VRLLWLDGTGRARLRSMVHRAIAVECSGVTDCMCLRRFPGRVAREAHHPCGAHRSSGFALRVQRAEKLPAMHKEGTTSMLHGDFSALTATQRAWLSYLAAASLYGFVLFLITHI
jgi:hypothetical protein